MPIYRLRKRKNLHRQVCSLLARLGYGEDDILKVDFEYDEIDDADVDLKDISIRISRDFVVITSKKDLSSFFRKNI